MCIDTLKKMSVFFTNIKICKYRISELIIPIFPETCYNRKQRGNLPERRIEIMKIYQDILRAKLRELEQEYEHLRNRLEICEGEDPGQIHRELESAKKEYDTLQLRLKSTAGTSRSPAVSRLAKVQLAYGRKTENLLKEQVTADLHSDANTPVEDREEASALYAEYAIDFVSMAVKYALLASLSAIDMQTDPKQS